MQGGRSCFRRPAIFAEVNMNSRMLFKQAYDENATWPFIDYMSCRKIDDALRDYYGAQSERALLDALGADFFYMPMRDISQNEGYKLVWKYAGIENDRTRICPLGIEYIRGAYDSKFMVDEAISGPLKNAISVRDIIEYRLPGSSDFDFSPLRDIARANDDRIRIGGLWTGILGDSYRMIGFERFLLGLCEMPDVIHSLIRRMTDMYIELNRAYFEAVKNEMEIWFFGNDFGSQMGLLMSRNMWQDFFMQPITELCSLAHGYGLKVMMHSCGGIEPIIGDLIEAGVDILDPVQVTARGMSIAELKDKYAGRLVFHGGLDTQQLLPRGTAQQVASQVSELFDAFGPKYIFAGSQILSDDIPVSNIVSAYDQAKRCKYEYSR